MLNLASRLIDRVTIAFLTTANKRKFSRIIRNKFSSNLIDFLDYSYNYSMVESDFLLTRKIENIRKQTRDSNVNEKVITYASPKSGDELFDLNGNVKAGKINYSLKGSFSRTGTGPKTGIQLKKLAEAFGSETILELGTNTGLSGCYFLASKNKPHLTTIEGSKQLCDIAKKNLHQISDNFEVINGMFDEVLDELILDNRKFDLAFIDGQHEEKATIHYAEKLKPLLNNGGIILFDDIYWSKGMHNAWEKIITNPDFDMSVSLQTRGFTRFANTDEKLIFHLTDYTGRRSYAREFH